MECYNKMIIAIVKQAVDDYVIAQKRINQLNDVEKAICAIYKEDVKRKNRRCYTYADAENERQEKIMYQQGIQKDIERFFRSPWYKNMCGLDSDYVIRRIKEKCGKF